MRQIEANEGNLRQGNCDTEGRDHDDNRSHQIEDLIGRHPLRPTVRSRTERGSHSLDERNFLYAQGNLTGIAYAEV